MADIPSETPVDTAPHSTDREAHLPRALPRKWAVRFLILLPIIAAVWLMLLRSVNLPYGEHDVDAFYHVKMADLGPAAWTTMEFPPTTMSVWEETFCDKELMFHGLLFIIRSWQRALPLPMDPPFHFAAFIVILLVLAVFTGTLVKLRAGPIALYLFMLICLVPSFTTRLLMLRPHNLAIILLLTSCIALAKGPSVRNLILAAVLGAVAAWAYSPPLFILMPACAFALVGLRANWKLSILLPVAAVLGLLAGSVVHPQFPNTFAIARVTSGDIIGQVLMGGSPVHLGNELIAPDGPWLTRNSLLFLLCLVNIGLFGLNVGTGGFRSMKRDTIAIMLLGLVTVVGTLLVRRLVEYSCPLSILALALLIRDLSPKERIKPLYLQVSGLLLLIILITRAVFMTSEYAEPRVGHPYEMKHFAGWIEKRLPPGEKIANVHWTDFPMLFYSAPQYRYLFGLDPMYAYARYPERVTKLEAFRRGEVILGAVELKRIVDARYAFVSRLGAMLARDMYNRGYVMAYQGPDGWLFDLDRSIERQQVDLSIESTEGLQSGAILRDDGKELPHSSAAWNISINGYEF